MYKAEHVEAAADFLEQYALGTCDTEQDIINTFVEVLPELAAEFNFNENDEICDLLNSLEVTNMADVIRCVSCWWYVRLSDCTEVAGEDFCEDCADN